MERMEAKTAWMKKLVRQFGDDEGNELSFNGTIVQALLMMNGAELNGEIGVKTVRNAEQTNVVDELLNRKPALGTKGMYDELFLMTLNRHPTPAEMDKLELVRGGKGTITGAPPVKVKGKAPELTPAADMKAFYQDVLWALLNTNEFMLNH